MRRALASLALVVLAARWRSARRRRRTRGAPATTTCRPRRRRCSGTTRRTRRCCSSRTARRCGGGPPGPDAKACAACHGDARTSMRGVAARYPAFDAPLARPVTLGERINLCRVRQQQAEAWRAESPDLLALEAYVALQSRGQVIAPPDDTRLAPFRARGEQRYRQRIGQLDLACAQCHDDHAGKAPRRQHDPAGPPDRLSDLSAGVAGAGLAAATAARLLRRRARGSAALRRARARGAGALPRLARSGDARREPGGAALRRCGLPVGRQSRQVGARTSAFLSPAGRSTRSASV